MGFAYHNIQRRQASYNNNKDGFYVGSCLLALRFSSLSSLLHKKREKSSIQSFRPVRIKQVVGKKQKGQANRHAPDSGAILYSKQN
jgi:hypothetical protein